MQNIQNIFGIPNVQQQFNQQQQQQQQIQLLQQQQRPAMQAAPAPAAKTLAEAPISNPNANAKELYAVENALKKDYDPVKREWVEENIKIQIERKPFAEGAMRAAYRMKIIEGMDVHGQDRFFVLKLSKDPHESTRQYYKDVESQMESRKWAQEYNKKGVPKEVIFILLFMLTRTQFGYTSSLSTRALLICKAWPHFTCQPVQVQPPPLHTRMPCEGGLCCECCAR